jgi:hypothetical protein
MAIINGTTNNDTLTVQTDTTSVQTGAGTDTVNNTVGFIQRVDLELKELKFQSDKAMLARKQALIDLKSEMDS